MNRSDELFAEAVATIAAVMIWVFIWFLALVYRRWRWLAFGAVVLCGALYLHG